MITLLLRLTVVAELLRKIKKRLVLLSCYLMCYILLRLLMYFFLPLQVVLYEDELADNGVSLLTVKVVKKSQVFLSSSIFFNNAFDLIQVVC